MNRTILQILAVAFCFAAVEALLCHECKLGLWDFCITTKTKCAAGEHCYSGEGKAAGFVNVMKKGCMAVANCNKTENVNFPSGNDTIYTITNTCCDFDLCNSAPAGLPGALPLTLASVMAVFAANMLI